MKGWAWLLFLVAGLPGCAALHARESWAARGSNASELLREVLVPRHELVTSEQRWSDSEIAAAETAAMPVVPPPAPTGSAGVRVYFGSNRDFSQRGGIDRSSNRLETNQYGECVVTIPDIHQFGRLERPSVWRFDFRESASKHVVLQSALLLDREECLARIRNDLGTTDEPDLFVFVHGYNVQFAEAAQRTAQMAYDLQFHGVPIFYSWPSDGRLTSYGRDVRVADASVGCVTEFLSLLAQDTGARRIHLVAHSMGNRALVGALAQLAADPGSASRKFDEVIFAAPDLDADQFAEVLAPRIEPVVRRATIYTSGSDLALWAARMWHRTFRLGQRGSGNSIPGYEWIEVVDTTSIGFEWFELGHAAYGGELLADVRRVITGQPREVLEFPPSSRPGRSIPWGVGRPDLPSGNGGSRIMPPIDRWR